MIVYSIITDYRYLEDILNYQNTLTYDNKVNYVILTNKSHLKSYENEKITIKFIDDHISDFEFSRKYKFGIYTFFIDEPILYCDSTIQISNKNIIKLCSFLNSNPHPILWFKHNKRKNGFQEAVYCFMVGKIKFSIILKYLYYSIATNCKSSLAQGGIFIINSNKSKNELETWKSLFYKIGGKRDQLSLSLLKNKKSVILKEITKINFLRNQYEIKGIRKYLYNIFKR